MLQAKQYLLWSRGHFTHATSTQSNHNTILADKATAHAQVYACKHGRCRYRLTHVKQTQKHNHTHTQAHTHVQDRVDAEGVTSAFDHGRDVVLGALPRPRPR